MKYEPALDKCALMEVIRHEYGFPITHLTFLPEGWVGCHYIGYCDETPAYFVTLLTDSRLSRLQAERLDFTLRLTSHLYERDLFRSLVPPRRTLRGELKADFEGQPLVLYDYISGGTLASQRPYSQETLASLGRLIGRLHRVTPKLDLEAPYVEDFSVPFEADLREGLAELDQVDFHRRPGEQTLREVFLPVRKELLGLLDRLKGLGETAQALQPDLVLVHTDPTPANILHTDAGELILVDWEGARLAQAEQDLALLTGEGFQTLLAAYLREAGQPRLYPQLFAFYFHRRYLEDVTDLLVQVLHENATDEQDQLYLDGVKPEFIDAIPFFEHCEDLAAGWLASIEAL